MVGKKLDQKYIRVLVDLAFHGPASKKMIERRMKPPIDKPTIYKIVKSLLSAELVRIHHQETHQQATIVRYYQITKKALASWLDPSVPLELSSSHSLPKFQPKKSDWFLKVLEKNPDLVPLEWQRVVGDLEAELVKSGAFVIDMNKLHSWGSHKAEGIGGPFDRPWRNERTNYYVVEPESYLEVMISDGIIDNAKQWGGIEEAANLLQRLFKILEQYPEYRKFAVATVNEKLKSAKGFLEDLQGELALLQRLQELGTLS